MRRRSKALLADEPEHLLLKLPTDKTVMILYGHERNCVVVVGDPESFTNLPCGEITAAYIPNFATAN